MRGGPGAANIAARMIGLAEPSGPNAFVERIREIFSADGLLASARNFEYRPEQQAMAVAVATE